MFLGFFLGFFVKDPRSLGASQLSILRYRLSRSQIHVLLVLVTWVSNPYWVQGSMGFDLADCRSVDVSFSFASLGL